VQTDSALDCPWGNEVCAGETGQKIVEGRLIREIDDRQLRSHRETVVPPKPLGPNRQVEKVPGLDARRVCIRVVGSGRHDMNQRRSKVRRVA